ncbi:MAG TPA: MarR family transcriptional regulator [Mycobacteriales bacterium]|nr:MarR family transcriptional regulator [Mycobacteriales bacterium]
MTRDSDEVARLLGEWERERPDVDLAPLEVFSRVSRLAVHLSRARAEAFAAVELEEWGFDVLAALRRSGAPYRRSPGALVRETLVTSATMTHRIDRLEAAGLVERRPDPDDGRGVLVGLTAAGRARVDRALDLLVEAETALLRPLPARDRTAVAAALRRLLVAVEEG